MSKIRIFLADDHAVVRAGVKALVEHQSDMIIIGEATDGKTAVHLAATFQPDVIVMDLSMPELNGMHATTEIRQTHPHIRVVVLSIHEDKSYVRELLTAGATGYVLKRSAANVLIQAIRTVAMGGLYLDPALGEDVVNTLTNPEQKPHI